MNRDKTQNLFVYNLESQNWTQVTSFDAEQETGVLDYEWLDSKTLIFNQGVGIDNWMHKVNIDSPAEILKVERINGEILLTNSDLEIKIDKQLDKR